MTSVQQMATSIYRLCDARLFLLVAVGYNTTEEVKDEILTINGCNANLSEDTFKHLICFSFVFFNVCIISITIYLISLTAVISM